MAVIGVITCEIFELELAHLLAEDADARRISVLEDRRSARLIALLEERCHPGLERLPHVHAFHPEPREPVEVLLRVLEVTLHRRRPILRRALGKAANELEPYVHVLLLGYGLCGSALDDPRAVLDVDLPIFIPMDQGRPVDDCVALCLGGREPYVAAQREVPGTFFLTPGWSAHWTHLLSSPPKNARRALGRVLAGYERALLVQTPALPDEELRRRGAELARLTGLRLETRRGTMDPLLAAWAAAKDCARSAAKGGERGDPP